MSLPEAIEQAPLFWVMMMLPVIASAIMTYITNEKGRQLSPAAQVIFG